MTVADLAKELSISPDAVLAKLKALMLKSKDKAQELSPGVLIVVRNELSKDIKSGKTPILREVRETKVDKILREAEKAEQKTKKVVEKAADKEKPKEKVRAVSKVPKKTEEVVVAEKEPAKKKVKEPVKAIEPKVSVPKPIETVLPAPLPKSPEPKPAIISQAPEVKEVPKPKPITAPVVDEPFVSVKPLKRRRKPGDRDVRSDFRSTSTPMSTSMDSNDRSASGQIDPNNSGSSAAVAPVSNLKPLELNLPIAVKDLAVKLQQKSSIILKKLLDMGVFANINQSLSEDIVRPVAEGFGFKIEKLKTKEEQLVHTNQVVEDPKLLKPRPPVVTFMGHVDHGKTSLLDRIRKAKVADQEHGGITQHIGAYTVNHAKGKITFLDTPGHEAFTAMRARGAHITDLVVLVVAADEGLMPQTMEAIDHARAANVPILVALNKMDRPGADADRVKKQLGTHDLLPEEWGGKTIVVGVSAVTGEGIDQLLDMILLEAEILELRANYDRNATGIIVEAHMSQKGPMASVIVQNGILKEGAFFVVGQHFGKIRAMFDDLEKPIKEAGPSMAAEILGLPSVPEAGEIFYIVDTDRQAREITDKRREEMKLQKHQSGSRITLEDLYSQIQEGKVKELNVILKADVQGSLEAVIDSLRKIPSDEVQVKFIHVGVGDINASDVILASASSAIIIGFHVDVDVRGKKELEKNPVEVRKYRIIYDAVNEMRNALEGLLEPRTKRKFVSRVEIREVFKLSKSGIVAGCFVQKGKVNRKAKVEVLRNGEVVFTGAIGTLKRFKDDVKEVAEGFECGITINGFNDVRAGDILEAFDLERIERKL